MASPEFQEILDMLAERRAANAGRTLTLEERREGTNKIGKRFENLDGITTKAVDADGVPAEWVAAPNAADDKALLYLHGGGYVTGSIESHRGIAANLSRATDCRTLIIDYRLAPEYPFPSQIEDAERAYRWLLDEGFDGSSIAIAGDSAGGGLTVAALIISRILKAPAAAGVCISPWVDMEGIGDSMTSKADEDPMVTREGLLEMASLFLRRITPRSPLAAPLYADITGLPPLLIMVGTAEVLLDDAVRLHEKALAAGVDSTLEKWDEMVHIWPWFAPFLPEGQAAIDRIGEFVKGKLAAASQA